MVSLSKGQSVRLEKTGGGSLTKVSMGLGWDVRKAKGLMGMFGAKGADIDLDASCLVFDSRRQQLDQIWFQQLTSKDGSIVHSGDNLTGAGDGDDETISVDLSKLPADAQSLVFTVNSFRGDSFDRIENAYCRLVDLTNGQELARFDLTGSGSHTGQVMATLTRSGAQWSMKAIGIRTQGRTFHDMMTPIMSSI
ncbi:TerD family protein [Sphingomonas sp. PP-CC-3G-468]|uniref:TerD family protein n=1 Tax=Sphingomonas sp. PP-CC-3G-468 TaxID=2135656 RepID=UPI00104E0E81|nr:TerD family protein [Sphingomonas sp. PP-CC-3G-468]TCM07381.1 tellurium resistance protein TerZ [Sphingomonas sp. PP-CC-3G-468]